jgi:hypothetical protein
MASGRRNVGRHASGVERDLRPRRLRPSPPTHPRSLTERNDGAAEGSGRLGGAGIRALQDASARLPSADPGTSARVRPADHDTRPPETALSRLTSFRDWRLEQDSNLRHPSSGSVLYQTELANRENDGTLPAFPLLTPPSLEPVRGTRAADHEVRRRAPPARGHQLLHGREAANCFVLCRLVAAEGLEPSSAASKTAVLPLDDAALEVGRGVKPR